MKQNDMIVTDAKKATNFAKMSGANLAVKLEGGIYLPVTQKQMKGILKNAKVVAAKAGFDSEGTPHMRLDYASETEPIDEEAAA